MASDTGFKVPFLPGVKPKADEKIAEETVVVKQPEEPSEPLPVETTKDEKDLKPEEKEKDPPSPVTTNKNISLPYEEPKWGGTEPPDGYFLEVIKNGSIVDKLELNRKSFFTLGRFYDCHFRLEHPTLSRYHAVLQYKSEDSPERPERKGFYLMDLNSTHGTFHNKKRCFPNTYYRLRVGHAFKLGGSTRMIVMQGPEAEEEETVLTATELMEKAKLKQKLLEEERKKAEELEKEKESAGISWGMGEDATEEDDDEEGNKNPDMALNPFSRTDKNTENESLYLDDPKRTLRGWFEREGYELEYKCEEKGYAQFCCKIELPIEEGNTVIAEATVKGKKKEAVVQCALEACRILDRHGVLRQSNHESKAKKKIKNWEENDFYDSDEDEFLDRTGSLETKRKSRMQLAGKLEKQEVDTYDSLTVKLEALTREKEDVAKNLNLARAAKDNAKDAANEEDLDAFMANIASGKVMDNETFSKLKRRLFELQKEEDRLTKLINIAKPVSLPALKEHVDPGLQTGGATKKQAVTIGKRKGSVGSRKTINIVPTAASRQATSSPPSLIQPEDEKKNQSEVLSDKSIESANELSSQTCETKSGDNCEGRHTENLEAVSSTHGSEEPKEVNSKGVTDNCDNSDITGERKKPNKRRKLQPTLPDDFDPDKVEGDYDSKDEKYATWMPPSGQTGDGRTSLNEKFGY